MLELGPMTAQEVAPHDYLGVKNLHSHTYIKVELVVEYPEI